MDLDRVYELLLDLASDHIPGWGEKREKVFVRMAGRRRRAGEGQEDPASGRGRGI